MHAINSTTAATAESNNTPGRASADARSGSDVTSETSVVFGYLRSAVNSEAA
jgi:hypothetical protein